MAEHLKIGVVTVTFNSEQVLPGFLRSLSLQSHSNFALFVVDNASKDDTVAALRTGPIPNIRLMCNRENLGVAEANNQGICAALSEECDLILLLNNDTEFEKELLAKLVEGLRRFRADMCSPKIMYHDQPNRVWAAGGEFHAKLGYRAVHFGEGELDLGQFDESRPVTYVPTCCVLIKGELFAKVGLMDPLYFVYLDDTDFMYRAMRSGAKLMYLADTKLLHKIGHLTGGKGTPFSARYGTRNRVYFWLKHLGILQGAFWAFVYWSYCGIRMIAFRDTFELFKIKQRAFGEGVRLYFGSRSDKKNFRIAPPRLI
jgi:GT2 family glycosyltransferase